MWNIIKQDNSKDMTLVNMLRGINYELKSAPRSKKIDKLVVLLNDTTFFSVK